MLVHLTSTTYDLAGAVAFDALEGESNLGETRRRVNRIATLDGGVVLNDFGFSHGDRTITLVWVPRSEAEAEAVAYLVRTYSRLRLSIRHEVLEVAPQGLQVEAKQSTLTLLVVGKLNV